MIAAFLLLGLSLPEEQTIRLYSRPIELRPGQVHNRVDPPIQLPNGLSRSIAVTSFEVDVVEVTEDGRERSVPLYEGYNHHFITLLGSLEQMQRLYNHSAGQDPLGGECVKPSHDHGMLGTNGNRAHKQGYSQFGGASGAEFRNNPHDFPAPYAFVLRNVSHFLTVLHVINSKGFAPSKAAGSSTRLLECPCTPQRKIDVAAGTIDGCLPRPAFHCSDTLVAQGNGGCSLAAYTGGYRCCEDGVHLVDTDKHPEVLTGPVSTFQLKFTIHYHDFDPRRDRELRPTSCCDVTQGARASGASGRRDFLSGNIEYNIPKCAEGTPASACVHVATNVQMLDWSGEGDTDEADEVIELVHAAGHMHLGGMHIDLIDELTGQLVCRSTPTYGSSAAAGDEAGFLVGIQPCVWGPLPLKAPPRFKRSHPMRTIAHYNSSVEHTGVMSLWLMSAAAVKDAPRPAMSS